MLLADFKDFRKNEHLVPDVNESYVVNISHRGIQLAEREGKRQKEQQRANKMRHKQSMAERKHHHDNIMPMPINYQATQT